MKVFISQPMNGYTDKEIETSRINCERIANHRLDSEITVIDSFFKNAPHEAAPLWFLSKSIELLSTADAVVFAKGWEKARGCRIEHECAVAYGIPCVYE